MMTAEILLKAELVFFVNFLFIALCLVIIAEETKSYKIQNTASFFLKMTAVVFVAIVLSEIGLSR